MYADNYCQRTVFFRLNREKAKLFLNRLETCPVNVNFYLVDSEPLKTTLGNEVLTSNLMVRAGDDYMAGVAVGYATAIFDMERKNFGL